MLTTGTTAPATKKEPSCHCPAFVEPEMGMRWDCHSDCLLLLLLCPLQSLLAKLHWEMYNRCWGKNGKQLLLLSLEVPK